METLVSEYADIMHEFFLDAIHNNVDSKYWSYEMFKEWRHIRLFQNATPYFHRHEGGWIIVPLPK